MVSKKLRQIKHRKTTRKYKQRGGSYDELIQAIRAENVNLEQIRTILANSNLTVDKIHEALMIAIMKNKVKVVEILLQQYDNDNDDHMNVLNNENDEGYIPLPFAMLEGNNEIVILLLQKGVNADGFNFDEFVFSHTNLHYTKINGGSFVNAKFIDTNLSHTTFIDCDFTDADMTRAIITDAVLTECDFINAILTYADFTGATVTNPDFTGANIDEAIGIITSYTTDIGPPRLRTISQDLNEFPAYSANNNSDLSISNIDDSLDDASYDSGEWHINDTPPSHPDFNQEPRFNQPSSPDYPPPPPYGNLDDNSLDDASYDSGEWFRNENPPFRPLPPPAPPPRISRRELLLRRNKVTLEKSTINPFLTSDLKGYNALQLEDTEYCSFNTERPDNILFLLNTQNAFLTKDELKRVMEDNDRIVYLCKTIDRAFQPRDENIIGGPYLNMNVIGLSGIMIPLEQLDEVITGKHQIFVVETIADSKTNVPIASLNTRLGGNVVGANHCQAEVAIQIGNISYVTNDVLQKQCVDNELLTNVSNMRGTRRRIRKPKPVKQNKSKRIKIKIKTKPKPKTKTK
jgi:uncharacterized protein YjbI with pentapeptide repeats